MIDRIGQVNEVLLLNRESSNCSRYKVVDKSSNQMKNGLDTQKNVLRSAKKLNCLKD